MAAEHPAAGSWQLAAGEIPRLERLYFENETVNVPDKQATCDLLVGILSSLEAPAQSLPSLVRKPKPEVMYRAGSRYYTVP